MIFLSGCYVQYHQPFSTFAESKRPEWDRAMAAFHKSSEVKYDDKETGNWQTPNETETLKTGDCKAHAVHLQYLLNKEKISNRIVVGKMHEGDLTYHAWNEVVIDTAVYVADSTNSYLRQKKYIPKTKYIESLVSPSVKKNLESLTIY